MGGFRRIFPRDDGISYSKFFDQSSSLCAETAASRTRTELAKQQRDHIQARERELEHFRKRLGPPPPIEAPSTETAKEELHPESPQAERKSVAAIQRRLSLRMSARPPQRDSPQRDSPQLAEGIVPYGTGVSPQRIRDDEELERLTGMQLRDSLVRSLGVSEQLQVALSLEDEAAESRPGTGLSAPQKPLPLFPLTGDSGGGVTHSYLSTHSERLAPSQPPTLDSTPLHSLPGAAHSSAPPFAGSSRRVSGFGPGTLGRPQSRNSGWSARQRVPFRISK